MKKPYKFTELSDVMCRCGRKLKKNLLAKKPGATKCYKCFMKHRTN